MQVEGVPSSSHATETSAPEHARHVRNEMAPPILAPVVHSKVVPPRLPDANALLSGKARATIEQIFALIHAANPTDRGLSPRETSERYALKSRLQSFLIHHHAAVLDVAAEGGEGVVSIRHRAAGRDAAHAVVAALDAAARRWVETELTLAALPVTSAPAPVPIRKRRQAEPGDALGRGHAAMEVYDFDAARDHFEAALASHGVAAARALVLLLIDHLGLDEEALAAVPRLPVGAVEDPETLAALALAAARSGDARAERWARASRSAAAWVELAHRAVRAGVVDAAIRAVDAVREIDGAHPALPPLGEAIAGLRRDARRPLEEALMGAFEQGDGAEVDRLLPTVPADAPIVALIRAHRRQLDARAAAEAAFAAYARKDFAGVLVHARRAHELGDDEIRVWVADAASAAKEALASRACALARAAVNAGILEPYLALDALSRAEIRGERAMPLLDLLERIPDRPGRIEAARALERALGAPGGVDALAAHARLLDGLPEYRKLRADAQARRQQGFLDGLGAAEDAWLSGDLDASAHILATLDRTLAATARQRLDELDAAVGADRSWRDAVARVDVFAASGDLLGARDLARSIGSTERAVELAAAVIAQWEVEVFGGAEVPLRDVMIPDDDLRPLVNLSDDGALFYVVHGPADRLFVRVVETETHAVRTAVMLRPPGALTGVHSAVHGDVLTVFGRNGALLQLSTTDWEVRRWCPPPARLRERRVEAAALVADRYVWYTLGLDDEAESIVLDVTAWPTVRHWGLRGCVVPLLGASVPTVVRLPPEGGIVGHGAGGGSLERPMKLALLPAARITVAPAGDGLLGFGEARAFAEMGKDGVPIVTHAGTEAGAVVHLRDDGMFRVFGMKDVLRTDGLDVATSTDANCFVVRRRRGSDAKLYGGRVDDWEITSAIDAIVPPSTIFVRDSGSRFVRALAWAEDGITIFDPTSQVPGWEMATEVDAVLDVAGLSAPFSCAFGRSAPALELLMDQNVHAQFAAANWRGAADALDRLDVTRLPSDNSQHWYHMRALVALWLGDMAGARAAVRAAQRLDGGCRLDAVVAVVDALDRRPSGRMGAYVQRLITADAHLSRGEANAARDLLDHAHTWRAFEQQGLVRLAAAWLQLAPQTPAERFRKRLALAALCDGPTTAVPIPPRTWSQARVADVVAAARSELG